jgi:hypothetical protein
MNATSLLSMFSSFQKRPWMSALWLGAVCLLPATLQAHHGRDFLLLQDAEVPLPFTGSLAANAEWTRAEGQEAWALETAAELGVLPFLSVGASVEFADERGSIDFASIQPYVRLELISREKDWPIRMALFSGYRFAEEPELRTTRITILEELPAPKTSTITRTVTTTTPGGGTGGTDEEPLYCGPEFGPDAPPCPPGHVHKKHNKRHGGHGAGTSHPATKVTKTTRSTSQNSGSIIRKKTQLVPVEEGHEHEGIHRHGENVWENRLILEADLTSRDVLLLNLIHILPEDGKSTWGYAAGIRHSFSHHWAVGVEAVGDFDDDKEHEIVAGTYFSPVHSLTVKCGIGFGLTDSSPDLSLRTGLVWRF